MKRLLQNSHSAGMQPSLPDAWGKLVPLRFGQKFHLGLETPIFFHKSFPVSAFSFLAKNVKMYLEKI